MSQHSTPLQATPLPDSDSFLLFSMRTFFLVAVATQVLACGSSPKRAHTAVTDVQPPAAGRAAATPAESLNATRADAGRQLLVGWYCPQIAAGRPGIRPLAARQGSWSSDAETLAELIRSRQVKRMTVWSWDGREAGHFDIAGAATSQGGALAIGSYTGASTCAPATALGHEAAPDDPLCVAMTGGCSIAFSDIEAVGGYRSRPYEEAPEVAMPAAGGACVADDVLWIDTDGDGVRDGFALDELLGTGEAPVELPLASSSTAACEARFSGPVGDGTRLVFLAVADYDGDGRLELIFRRGGDQVVIYGSPDSPLRMERLAIYEGTLPPK